MLKAVWLRDFRLSDPIDDLRDELESHSVEDMLILAADEKKLAGEPRFKHFSPQDRLHMKYTGKRPGISEKLVVGRISSRKLPFRERRLEDNFSGLARLAGPEGWTSARGLVEDALKDVRAFRSLTPTQAQKRILLAAAVEVHSLVAERGVTEKLICEASGVSEKTLRQWTELLGEYFAMRTTQFLDSKDRREDKIRRHMAAEGWPGPRKTGKN
jgi:hypothetical protein